MGELDDLMIQVAQVQRRLSRGNRWREVWSGVHKVTSCLQLDKLVLDKERQRQVAGEELAMLGVDRDVKERTFHIQAEHIVLGFDDGPEHVKILVGCLTLDRCLVEVAEGMDDALLALVRRSVNP